MSRPGTDRHTRRTVRDLVVLVVLAVVLLLSPEVLTDPEVSLVTRAVIFGLMASSLDIAYGHGGLASLGHAALAGTGGYTVGILSAKLGITSPFIGLAAALAVSAVVSAVFAALALRTRGIYFILATFTLGQMMANLTQQWSRLKSPGVEAIVGITVAEAGLVERWTPVMYLRATVLLALVMLVLIHRLLHSPFGLALRGVRDNPERMQALGYSPWRYRMAALTLAGTLGGFSGALLAYHGGIVAPANVGVVTSGLLVLMVIFGGGGSFFGPLLGGFVITVIQFYAGELSPTRSPLIIGAIFIVTALALRGGVIGTVNRLLRRRRMSHGAA